MNSKQLWNKLAENYDKRNEVYEKAYSDIVNITLQFVNKESTILDYGCGTGITTNKLAKYVKSITAIDISDVMIQKAMQKSEKLGLTNVKYIITDLFDERIKRNKYNVVTAFNMLHFIKDIKGTLKYIYNLLPEKGFFISITDCLGESNTFKDKIVKMLSNINILPYVSYYKITELEDTIKSAGFSIIRTDTLYESPPNYFIVATKQK